VLLFDWAEMEEPNGNAGPIIRFLKSLLGDEQAHQVRDKIAEDGVSFDDVEEVLMDLVNGIFGQYGMAEGDSDASQES
jgi:hypothetical protein